jgi:hypothetical protein
MTIKLLFSQVKFINCFIYDDLSEILKSKRNRFLFYFMFNANLDRDRFAILKPFQTVDFEDMNMWGFISQSFKYLDNKTFISNVSIVNKLYPINQRQLQSLLMFFNDNIYIIDALFQIKDIKEKLTSIDYFYSSKIENRIKMLNVSNKIDLF